VFLDLIVNISLLSLIEEKLSTAMKKTKYLMVQIRLIKETERYELNGIV
jgi:hypothetical protein